jgi:hypothetical protein
VKNETEKLLGKKKLRLSELITNIKSKETQEHSNDDDEEDIKHYKNAFSGSFNLSKNLRNEDWKPEEYSELKAKNEEKKQLDAQKSKQIKNNHQAHTFGTKLLNLLPVPTKRSYDKIKMGNSGIDNEDKEIFSRLACSDNINTQTSISGMEGNKYETSGNVFEVERTQLLDNNWETKYLTELSKQEFLKDEYKYKEPTQLQRNKNHITSIIADYKSEKDVADANKELKSKHSKISTRAKYGW